MNIWFGKATVAASLAAIILIRNPHGMRSRKVGITESRRGKSEKALLLLMWISGVILPALWIATPIFSFADYPLRPAPYICGALCLVPALWLFYRSHADLGTNWSSSLEIREQHRLITSGIYKGLRHPMYAALLLEACAQVLFASNWIVGPAKLVALTLLLSQRLPREERMMREHFGPDYEAYAGASCRLIPGVW